MKILLSVLLKQIAFTLFFFMVHMGILVYLNTNNLFILTKIYLINFSLTSICLGVIYFIHKKSPEFVGFSYLFLVLFKMAFVVVVLLMIKEYQKNSMNFMVSYLCLLFIEVYLLVKELFIKENDF
jgi:hypothetical protein